MSKPDAQSLHEFAWEIVLDHAQDIEYMSVGEIMSDNSMFDEVTEGEFDEIQKVVHDEAIAYAKALTKPEICRCPSDMKCHAINCPSGKGALMNPEPTP